MANGRTTTWQRICSLLGAHAAVSTDAQLLAHFVAERDETAFAELVRRHGPMIYGVCRRVLVNPDDADDAYQATFLILAHKPSAVRKADSLSCWLHGVALRVSLRLKHQLLRRPDRAALPADVPQPETDEVSWREVRRLLDEELARLPERFRQPLILCYLEGKTRDEAADELGWSLPTFRGRLERGRERLRGRLERRGLTLSAALLATLAARKLEAAIPTTTASARAAALATEVLRTMFLSQVKMAAWWCLAVLFLSAALGGTAYRCVALEPDTPSKAAEPPKPSKPPTPPEEDGVVKDYKAHLEQFRLTITLRPQEQENSDTRYPVSDLRLHVSSGPFAEPGGSGTAFARITNKQAAKIIDVLAKDNFFRDSVADWERLNPPKGNYVTLVASYHIGNEPQVVKRIHALAWDLHMVEQLKAIRACVDGEAAKALDKMLQSLVDERKQGDKNELLMIQDVADFDKLWVGGEDAVKRWVALDGVLPFAAWPKELTDDQRKLRDDGLTLAKTWLDKQTVDFHPTRAPNIGDAVRYSKGVTLVAQEWKGLTPSELYAKDSFHINVLLIQEGYSPFVRNAKSNWDKKTLACYESAEQYATLHNMGIWKEPNFAESLKKIAEKMAAAEKADPDSLLKWRSLRSTQLPKVFVPPVQSLTFSPDGELLLVDGNGKNRMALLAADTLKEESITYPLNGACRPLGFTKSGMAWALSLVSEGNDPNVAYSPKYELQHLTTGRAFWSFAAVRLVRQAVLSPDMKYLAVTDYENTTRVSLQNITSGKPPTELGKHKSEVRCLAVSPDGKTLATGSAFTPKQAAEIMLWDANKRSMIAVQELPADCKSLQFTRDGSRLIALMQGKNGQDSGANVLWLDARSGKLLDRLEGDGALMRRTAYDLDARSEKLLDRREWLSGKEQAPVAAIAATQGGKLLAVLCGGRVRMYDTDSGKELAAPDSGDKVSALAFSPNGSILATGDQNGGVTLWEALRR